MEPTQRFEIQLSHICNNRCVFCVSGQMTELGMAKPTPLPELQARFDEAAARGITKVTILGGEPTIHPTFFPTVEYALELGFETIVIFTNAARLDKQDFVDRIMALGRDKLQWRISIQGWDEATHDATTKKPGAFARIVKGLETLGALGQHISCNMCVVEQNYRSLAALPEFVTRYDIRQVHLDMVRPRDAGMRSEDYLDGILPDYAALGEVMRGMFEELERRAPGFDINVGNLPYCQLPQWAHRIHHGGNTTYTVSADGPGRLSVVAWDKYEDKRSDKRKLDSCRSCVFERRCDGFVELYAQRRGTAQFVPVSRERLRRLDAQQRTFVHQIDAALVSLVRERVAGWRLHAADDSEFDRWAVQHWVHEDGGRAELRFLPAATPGGGDAEHSDFVLRLASWRGVDETALEALLVGVGEHMAAQLGRPLSAAPTCERLAARRKLEGLLDAGAAVPRTVRAAALRLLGTTQLPRGWRVAAGRGHGSGATLRFAGPARARADLRLLAGDGRVAGKWDFAGPGPAQLKRELAVAVTQLLRAPAAASIQAGAAAR